VTSAYAKVVATAAAAGACEPALAWLREKRRTLAELKAKPDWYRFALERKLTSKGTGIVKSGSYEAWYLNGQRHRVDGPAYKSGSYEAWYLNGQLHRVDGPAYKDGSREEWYLNGQLQASGGAR
jgi:hypothetical protein